MGDITSPNIPGAMPVGPSNDVHKRYLRMNGHHDKMDGSPKPLASFDVHGQRRCHQQNRCVISSLRLGKMADMPANWDWELFRAGA